MKPSDPKSCSVHIRMHPELRDAIAELTAIRAQHPELFEEQSLSETIRAILRVGLPHLRQQTIEEIQGP